MPGNLAKYFAKRLLRLLPVFFVILSASFFLMRAAPGGPFDKDKVLPPEVEKNLKELYGLNDPLYRQYFNYLSGMAKGDMGISFTYTDKSVWEIIRNSFGASFLLGITAFLFALSVGLFAGIVSASKRGKFTDAGFFSFTVFAVSVPTIVLAPLLVYVFGLRLGIFPVAGWGTIRELILPAFSLGIIYSAFVARLTRSGMIETLEKDYVKTARSSGVSEGRIMYKYALKGSLLPVVSYLAPAFAGIITGSLVIERIFYIPGLGQHFVQSALNRDYPLALGIVVFYSAILLLANLAADIIYALLDPRITYESDH